MCWCGWCMICAILVDLVNEHCQEQMTLYATFCFLMVTYV